MNMEYKVNGRTYEVIQEIGHGKGGYCYLVKCDDGNLYALKKMHHEPCDFYQFDDKMKSELEDYERLKDIVLLPKMIDYDIDQEIVIKEYIDGDNIVDLIKNDVNIEKYVEDVRSMAERCQKHNLNIDYFPTNFIVKGNRLYYVDYECNDYMEEWNFENWGIKYWSKTREFLDYFNK